MSERILPKLDQFAAMSPERERALEREAVAQFAARHPECTDADSLQVLKEFCSVHVVPITLRNLEIALQDAICEGKLDPATASENFEAQRFLATCPEYENGYANRANADRLLAYLRGKGLPITVDNLQAAFFDCLRRKIIRPTAKGFGGSANALFVRDSIASEDREKYHDKLYESDIARKRRDAQLRLDATRSRFEMREGR